MTKWVSCKIGTIPSYILISERYKIRVGLIIRYKKEDEVRYRYARIFEVHDSGYFKAVVVEDVDWFEQNKTKGWHKLTEELDG